MIDTKAIAHIVSESASKVVPKAFLSAVLREMDREDVERIALAYMLLRLSQRKRSKVRAIEADSVLVRPAPVLTPEQMEAERKRREEYELAVAQSDARLRAEFNATISSAISDLREAWRVEWTEDLLRQSFATGDGRTVTWGDATADDHRARIAMQERNAMGAMADIARHTQAIEDIEAAEATTLNGLARVAA